MNVEKVSLAKVALVSMGLYILYKLGLEAWCVVYGLLY